MTNVQWPNAKNLAKKVGGEGTSPHLSPNQHNWAMRRMVPDLKGRLTKNASKILVENASE